MDEDLVETARAYASRYILELRERLGSGIHGIVLVVESKTEPGRRALKLYRDSDAYLREKTVYPLRWPPVSPTTSLQLAGSNGFTTFCAATRSAALWSCKSLDRSWEYCARPEDRYALASALRELEDTQLVKGGARVWVLLVTAWARVSRGEVAQLADGAGESPERIAIFFQSRFGYLYFLSIV